jgi:DNA-binding transcriptional LysR family regulator
MKFLPDYPDIHVEIITDYGMRDIVADRYDAGVRLGEQVAKDMIAVRIGPDFRVVVVGAPSYFANRPIPQTPQDLLSHSCINLRLPTYDSNLTWEFEKNGKELNVHVEGQATFSSSDQILLAALQGFGLAYLPEDMVASHLIEGRLVQVLDDWCAPFQGYHIYYPSRRQSSPAFNLVVNALRHRE